MYVGYIRAGAVHDARFAPRGVAIDRKVPANVRIKRPLVPAMDIDDGWTWWRTSGTESGRGSCVPATVLWTPLFEVIKLYRSWSGYLTNGPSQRWEERAPPVEMETHHELIIIIIQCLWAAVGSPSKREDNVGAQSGPVEMLLPLLRLPRRSPTTRPDRYLASCCSILGSRGIYLPR